MHCMDNLEQWIQILVYILHYITLDKIDREHRRVVQHFRATCIHGINNQTCHLSTYLLLGPSIDRAILPIVRLGREVPPGSSGLVCKLQFL